MKITLSEISILSPQQIGKLASTLVPMHKRTFSMIEWLTKDVAAGKQQITAR